MDAGRPPSAPHESSPIRVGREPLLPSYPATLLPTHCQGDGSASLKQSAARMTLTHSSMRPRRWRESWIRSKPKQCISILALALTAFIVFLHSSNPFQAVSYIPDRLHNSFEKEVKRISKSDLASGRNANRTAKPRAAFVVLIRERQLSEILPTLRDIQWAFNDDHAYDYVFLSETEFTSWFKDTINDFLSKRPLQPKASFGLILPQDWNVPAHIDMDWAKKRWAMKMSANIPYAKSTTYRQMCR